MKFLSFAQPTVGFRSTPSSAPEVTNSYALGPRLRLGLLAECSKESQVLLESAYNMRHMHSKMRRLKILVVLWCRILRFLG